MINRDNYQAVRAYLLYLSEVLQRDTETVANARWQLCILLRWADEKPFANAPAVRPVFSRYLVNTPGIGYGHTDKPLGSASIKHTCSTARTFLTWLRNNEPHKYPMLTDLFISEIRPPRLPGEAPKDHQAVTLDMVRLLIAVPRDADDLLTRRDQAAAAFLFLSGMRATAFCTLTLQCVDVTGRKVLQYPTLGVHTKNQKAAETYLFDIPDLLEVVREWDGYVRTELPVTAPWYPVLLGGIASDYRVAGREPTRFRSNNLRDNLNRLFDRVGLPRMSPHKFRHGHAVYGLTHARDVGDLKAVSMNLMHKNLGITDGIYAVLNRMQMQEKITGLSQARGQGEAGDLTAGTTLTMDDIAGIVAEVLRQVHGGADLQ